MPWEQKAITAHLVDVETGQRLEFQYNPNDIVDEKSTAYAAIKIPGLSHPRYQYVAGEPRKITFQLRFFKGPVKESVDWLRSLLYPEHAGTTLANAPHKVLFLFGDLYPGVLCVVRQRQGAFLPSVRPREPQAPACRGGCAPRGIRRRVGGLPGGAGMIGRRSRVSG